MYTDKKNKKYVSSSRVIHTFYILMKKLPNTFYSKEIFDQISIALYFIMLAPEFQRAIVQVVEFWLALFYTDEHL